MSLFYLYRPVQVLNTVCKLVVYSPRGDVYLTKTKNWQKMRRNLVFLLYKHDYCIHIQISGPLCILYTSYFRRCIIFFGHVYTFSMYPNGEWELQSELLGHSATLKSNVFLLCNYTTERLRCYDCDNWWRKTSIYCNWVLLPVFIFMHANLVVVKTLKNHSNFI